MNRYFLPQQTKTSYQTETFIIIKLTLPNTIACSQQVAAISQIGLEDLIPEAYQMDPAVKMKIGSKIKILILIWVWRV